MTFRIVQNRLVYLFRNGISMYAPSAYNEHIAFPISKISSVTLVGSTLNIVLENNQEYMYSSESNNDAEETYKKLMDAMLMAPIHKLR